MACKLVDSYEKVLASTKNKLPNPCLMREIGKERGELITFDDCIVC